ncbi:hypothetical protein [Thermogymnomonas acidicola]|uniref:hypothetical protein n=1 Tax=Thermogymnomonas acidicola TaxID=399579 RepID=UPI00094666BB|nr:hypothetical protein [Thermogymnomonas acidicola]
MGADGAYSVIFSADQAHTHAADGPYGYSPEASIYEEAVRRAFISGGDLAHLLDIDEETVQGGAKPDSYWELLVLHGLLKELGASHPLHLRVRGPLLRHDACLHCS